jgi:hypothetical protein
MEKIAGLLSDIPHKLNNINGNIYIATTIIITNSDATSSRAIRIKKEYCNVRNTITNSDSHKNIEALLEVSSIVPNRRTKDATAKNQPLQSTSKA